MKIKTIKITLVYVISAFVLSACQQTDVLAEGANRAFLNLTSAPTLTAALSEDAYQKLAVSTGEYFALATRPEATLRDIYASLDLEPFEAAGLKVDQLPEGYAAENGRLILYSEFTDQAVKTSNTAPDQLMKNLISAQRTRIGYHAAMDHYGIELGNGNMIEWAADMSQNDKDLVFVLEPSVLIKAGLDPDKVKGWNHADVETMDAKGNKSTVKKLLKPFDLKK